AALQVNFKEAYCHTLAISLEIMLYHDGEPLTFDLVWDNGGWCSAMLENVS
ncbi:anti-adapter protein IraD, partial [Escherichia coli]